MYRLIYKHDYYNNKNTLKPYKLDILSYNIVVQEFIIAAIEYAKTASGKITVCYDNGNIYADIEIKIGLISGLRKEKFMDLASKSEDFLILPIKSKDKAAISIRFVRKYSFKNLFNLLKEENALDNLDIKVKKA